VPKDSINPAMVRAGTGNELGVALDQIFRTDLTGGRELSQLRRGEGAMLLTILQDEGFTRHILEGPFRAVQTHHFCSNHRNRGGLLILAEISERTLS
jgi:hypothetical protein